MFRFQNRLKALSLLTAVGALALAANANYSDPVPHQVITQPYRVCQDLDEITSRINNLYRKPFEKTIDALGVMQPETIYFKDVESGHEVACLTRELCTDEAHSDLHRPCWTCDGSHILFMGNRAYRGIDGKIQKSNWEGHKYIMNADYTDQRSMVVKFDPPLDGKDGPVTRASGGMYGKYNIMDPNDPKVAYYAVADKMWKVTLTDDGDCLATLICNLSNTEPKIIQDMSSDRKLLIQDQNADPVKGNLPYIPEIHVIDLKKKPGEPGAYYHHSMDYHLPEVKDDQGKVVHKADNFYQMHSLMFAGPTMIGWNYGPMTDVGEPLGYSLDISNGLDGTPQHGQVTEGSGKNKWGQYESHGSRIANSSYMLYFSGQPRDEKNQVLPGNDWGWGIYLRDGSKEDSLPRFVVRGPGGHIAGGNSLNPDVWAAHMGRGGAAWNAPETDAIVWGHVTGPAQILCHTYSDVRGGISRKGEWSGMDNNDYRPYSSVPRPLLSPDGTKLWFHSCMLDPTEQWVGIYVAVIDRPQPPLELGASAADTGVQLSWKPAAMHNETKGYHVYRGDGDGKNFVELTSAAIGATTFTDAGARQGSSYTYAVTAEEWSTLESDNAASIKVNDAAGAVTASDAGTVKGWNTTAPPAVADFKAVRDAEEQGQYHLTWTKNPSTAIRYYNIYFSTQGQPEIKQQRLLVSPSAGETKYLDWSAPIGTDANYAITAVDRQGNESAPAFVSVPK